MGIYRLHTYIIFTKLTFAAGFDGVGDDALGPGTGHATGTSLLDSHAGWLCGGCCVGSACWTPGGAPARHQGRLPECR